MATDDFFRSRLDQMIDTEHPLIVLSDRMPWDTIESALLPFFKRRHRPKKVQDKENLFGTNVQVSGGAISNAGRPLFPSDATQIDRFRKALGGDGVQQLLKAENLGYSRWPEYVTHRVPIGWCLSTLQQNCQGWLGQ